MKIISKETEQQLNRDMDILKKLQWGNECRERAYEKYKRMFDRTGMCGTKAKMRILTRIDILVASMKTVNNEVERRVDILRQQLDDLS